MIFKRSLLVALGCISSIMYSENDIAFWLPQKSSLRFHDNEEIKINQTKYLQFLDEWTKRLNKSWQKLLASLYQEAQVTTETLEAYMKDESLGNVYTTLKQKDLFESDAYIHEENIDPLVLNFIKRTVAKYSTKENIKIVLAPNLNTITATFGTDQTTHYLVCHATVYTKEHIQHYYDALSNNNGVFYIEPSSKKNVRFIELSNLLLVGIIEAACHIQHQNNFLTFLLSNFKFSGKRLSTETIKRCWHLTELRGMLESILQSKNPLETALFVGKVRNKSEKERRLWKEFTQGLADCYSSVSLKTFKHAVKEINEMYLQ